MASHLRIRLFDGAREALPVETEPLITIFDGSRQLFRNYTGGADVAFDFERAFSARVVVHVKNYRDSGFAPVPLRAGEPASLDLMLLRRGGSLNFLQSTWPKLRPEWKRFLAPKADYETTLEDRPTALATMLNVLAASETLDLTRHFRSIEWSTLRNDRFYCWVDRAFVDFVKGSKRFVPSPVGSHAGATRTFKQNDFNEANLQYSLHENAAPPPGLDGAVRVECDMDYYKDKGAHFLLEVLPNRLTGSRTNPALVYMLRWMAGRRAGEPDFAPPYIFI